MRATEPLRVFPFSAGGAALGVRLPVGDIALHDLSPRPRFGFKGAGSTSWLSSHNIPIPAVNRTSTSAGLRVLRLGREDMLLLAEGEGKLEPLIAAWSAQTGPKGYSAWREEGWAWMRLTGNHVEEAMSRLCALDLRPKHFTRDQLAQTRVADLDAVVARVDGGYDLFFDITMSAFFARAIAALTAASPESG
jgi:sarcosine oxidase subunit gamma